MSRASLTFIRSWYSRKSQARSSDSVLPQSGAQACGADMQDSGIWKKPPVWPHLGSHACSFPEPWLGTIDSNWIMFGKWQLKTECWIGGRGTNRTLTCPSMVLRRGLCTISRADRRICAAPSHSFLSGSWVWFYKLRSHRATNNHGTKQFIAHDLCLLPACTWGPTTKLLLPPPFHPPATTSWAPICAGHCTDLSDWLSLCPNDQEESSDLKPFSPFSLHPKPTII